MKPISKRLIKHNNYIFIINWIIYVIVLGAYVKSMLLKILRVCFVNVSELLVDTKQMVVSRHQEKVMGCGDGNHV